jgi:hypothetical protein
MARFFCKEARRRRSGFVGRGFSRDITNMQNKGASAPEVISPYSKSASGTGNLSPSFATQT